MHSVKRTRTYMREEIQKAKELSNWKQIEDRHSINVNTLNAEDLLDYIDSLENQIELLNPKKPNDQRPFHSY